MKIIVWVYLLSLMDPSLGQAATDLRPESEEQIHDEKTLEHSVDPDETETQKFSDLVKATMEMMGPETATGPSTPETLSQATTP